jgi:hypothetical protein
LLRLCGESLALLFGHFLFGAKGVRESMTWWKGRRRACVKAGGIQKKKRRLFLFFFFFFFYHRLLSLLGICVSCVFDCEDAKEFLAWWMKKVEKVEVGLCFFADDGQVRVEWMDVQEGERWVERTRMKRWREGREEWGRRLMDKRKKRLGWR